MSRTAIVLAFVVCTVLGALSYEYGHIALAMYFGYPTTPHYAPMDWLFGLEDQPLNAQHTLLVAIGAGTGNILEQPFDFLAYLSRRD